LKSLDYTVPGDVILYDGVLSHVYLLENYFILKTNFFENKF
jgi:hypothetical protein